MVGPVQVELAERTPGHRIFALDALRGLAACTVVLYHLRCTFFSTDPPWYLLPFFAGHVAVILFFVLSGYVLSMPAWRGSQLPYDRYLIRRLCRIYAPYVAALALSIIIARPLLFSQLPLTHWFYTTWHTPITLDLVLQHLFNIPFEAHLNTAFWSLKYEFEMSIIFPAICWAMLRLRGWATFALAILMDVGAYLASRPAYIDSLSSDVRPTLFYGSCFIYGALLSWKREEIATVYRKMPVAVKIAALALIIWTYYGIAERFLPFAACGVLVFVNNSRVRGWLEHPIPEYLGRISYSLYLTHGTVLFAMLILLYGKIPTVILIFGFGIVAFLVAHLFCVFIEEPMMHIGRRLTSKRKPEPLGRFSQATQGS